MRIVAVIPGRSKSKGIPNKNIRILSGKPMIAYAIENAVNSKYINRIIIVSDSEEVETIAEQYGVEYKKESDDLCRGDITLDEVVCEALKDEEYDYAVTLQPTSPTLKHITLDKAIQYAIENDYDTVLSAVNRPKLGWIEQDGKLIPDYKKRLNRQYLPKHYIETGAFVISKQYVLNSKTRFGQKVSVYEVDDDEAIDVDDFKDLVSAENILNRKSIAIVVNGNNSIGTGHVYRMLDLADMFFSKPVFYYDRSVTEKAVFGKTTYELNSYESKEELLELIEAARYDIVINDIQNTDIEYICKLKNLSNHPKVVNFEDMGDGAAQADLVINALYDKQYTAGSVYSGEDYYIVPKIFTLFSPIKINKEIKRVFVCFGGADPQNYTESIIGIVQNSDYKNTEFCFVIGRAKSNYSELMKLESDRIHLHYDVKSMPKLMSQCDAAITSRGRTCFELAYLGIPTLSIAQNETEMLHSFVLPRNGFLILDNKVRYQEIEKAVNQLLRLTYSERVDMHNKMAGINLKDGRNRIRDLIQNL